MVHLIANVCSYNLNTNNRSLAMINLFHLPLEILVLCGSGWLALKRSPSPLTSPHRDPHTAVLKANNSLDNFSALLLPSRRTEGPYLCLGTLLGSLALIQQKTVYSVSLSIEKARAEMRRPSAFCNAPPSDSMPVRVQRHDPLSKRLHSHAESLHRLPSPTEASK